MSGAAIEDAIARLGCHARPPVRPVPLGDLARLAGSMHEPPGTVDAGVIWGVKAVDPLAKIDESALDELGARES